MKKTVKGLILCLITDIFRNFAPVKSYKGRI